MRSRKSNAMTKHKMDKGTDNAMTKRKMGRQTMICKTLHRLSNAKHTNGIEIIQDV
jgi:hypothetical protein